jgi:hypothetical protein
MARTELKMQGHICESYAKNGGYGTKWDAAHAKGKPDLICSLPGFGVHLVEVKHRPEIDRSKLGAIKNPLEPKQVSEARKIIQGGGIVMGGLVIGGMASVTHSSLAYFDPLSEVWYLSDGYWVNYQPKIKFYVPALITKWRKP